MTRLTFQALAASLISALVTLAPNMARAVPNEPKAFFSQTTTATIARSDTDFVYVLALAQVGPAHFATIENITLTLSGHVFGDYVAVNTSKTSAVAAGTAELKATVTVYTPDLSLTSTVVPDDYSVPSSATLGVAIPVIDFVLSASRALAKEPGSFNKASFNINNPATYSAASGIKGTNLTATSTVSRMTDSTSPDFALLQQELVGYGSVYLPVMAAAGSTFIGGGNVASQFNTDAGADVRVTVNYYSVDEPASVSLFGLAMGMAAMTRKRRNIGTSCRSAKRDRRRGPRFSAKP